jgi:hypothetical protein
MGGPKTDEITGGQGKICNGDFNNIYFLPDVIRMINLRRK